MKKSESTIELAKALAKFQSEIKDPSKSGKANYGKYVTLDELLESIRPVLSQNGLSFLQFPGGDGQLITITTVLLHSSGEWIESEPFTLKSQKVDPQGAGSAVTYGRRYSLSAILGVAWDTDDDGQAASHAIVSTTERKAEPPTPINQTKPAFPDENTGPQFLMCQECTDEISQRVHDYSVQKFGRPLCMNCQKAVAK
ncbi:ERF family protein [Phascolarctobacterium faecium]|jgi:hypothetical protein|uniref:ERF family protein n=1 Tax=Phascolarctobacterium faecium TaxID=33025 RepID=UPI00351F943F